VVHAALRQVLGPDALQSGSYNKPGYLRLDFSWNQALSLETRSEIEEVTNLAIRGDLAVSAQHMSLPEAREFGAVALFGETYDESVRVIQIGGPWSRELCGGTHVSRSSQIGLIALTGESSVGSGSRRLEALVGIEAFRSLAAERALVTRMTEALKAPKELVEERLASTIEELKNAQRKLSALQNASLATRVPELISAAKVVKGLRLISQNLGALESVDDLRGLVSNTRERAGVDPVVVALFAVIGDKPMLVVATNDAARSLGAKAGHLVRVASSILGGGGGGKDDIAQGGGSDSTKISDAIEALTEAI
jgi:alanyl-tRNA synthetase